MPSSKASQRYDRSRLMKKARRASRRGAHAKAAEFYTRVLDAEPENADLLRRVAAQRVRAGQRAEALRDTQMAGVALARRGFVAEAIGVYREYTRRYPHEPQTWCAMSDFEIERGRRPDAVDVLVDGSSHFRARRRRSHGITLLKRAQALDPNHFEAGFRLADLLWRSGGGGRRVKRILESLAPHARSRRDRRRLYARLFRLSPTPRAGWRWLRAAFGGRST